ncbi:MAG: hypothetical protein F6K41_39415 [Symploca sp. SIO3E6]|nr:hypothetical protein [Caldora sp. SIO3E6]
MKHRATPDFWYYYRQLPHDIQELADRCYKLLKQDSRYPSLHFKKVGRFWSVRVGIHYRALAVEDGSDIVWFWIGAHAEYDRFL